MRGTLSRMSAQKQASPQREEREARGPGTGTHLLIWSGLWASWAFVSRNNQATLPLLVIATTLGAMLLVITLAVVVGIQAAYDVLWGPDPLRFGFWTNVGLDFLFVSLHVLVAAGAVALFTRKGRGG
jgi:heme/copper-type cytochrome/quinol oxidase subunit 3